MDNFDLCAVRAIDILDDTMKNGFATVHLHNIDPSIDNIQIMASAESDDCVKYLVYKWENDRPKCVMTVASKYVSEPNLCNLISMAIMDASQMG